MLPFPFLGCSEPCVPALNHTLSTVVTPRAHVRRG